MINTTQYVIKQIEERDIRFIRLWFTDIFGNLKNIAITPSDVEDAFEEGIGFDGSSIEGMASVVDSDLLLCPDASTFQVLPWRPQNSGVARMFCDVRTPEGKPFAGDSRHILMGQLNKAASMGYSVNIGCELEYFLFKDSTAPEPIDQGGYFDLTPLDNAADLRRDVTLMLEQMGIPVEYSHHEAAPSQQEVDLRFCDALEAADAVMTARLVAKEIACAHGVHASFMPKPLAGVAGSGLHTHQSLFDDEGNAFFDAHDPQGYGLSAVGKHYLAGLLKYAPEFTLVTNQYVNSYKRLVPGKEVPLCVSWGNGNRASLVRVPRYKPGKELSCRLEVRSVDSAANPYLAFAAMLAAGLAGIEEELELPAPLDANMLQMPFDQLAKLGVAQIPRDLSVAVDAFEGSALMRQVLGEHVHGFLVRSKRAEWEEYRSHVSAWEINRYLGKL